MHFCGGNKVTSLKATLAERVLGNISVSDLTPTAVEPFVGVRITLEPVLIIIPVGLTCVLITEVTGGQVGAAGEGTFLFGLVWHKILLSDGHEGSKGWPILYIYF